MKNNTDLAGYLRRRQAAAYLGISQRCLSDWQKRRLVPYTKVSHRVCLFRRDDLDKALGKLKIEAIGN